MPWQLVGLNGLRQFGSAQVGMVAGPGGSIRDLVWEGRCRQDLGQQRIGIKGYPLSDAIQLIQRYRRRCILAARRILLLRRILLD